MRASPETLEWIKGYYALMDEGRLDECDQYFTPEATLKIAHHPEVVGWDAIDRLMRGGMANPIVRSIVHEVRNAWQAEDDIVIFEVVAHYSLADGRDVDVPGIVIGEIADGRFKSQRIAADLSTVYGSSEASPSDGTA
ncbi:MAG TPA: nuclear transport factor 2 family protein [Actinomycetota bacterium]|nr:nuclear transport factor 2 family protein [Actinomycetota bacterium]